MIDIRSTSVLEAAAGFRFRFVLSVFGPPRLITNVAKPTNLAPLKPRTGWRARGNDSLAPARSARSGPLPVANSYRLHPGGDKSKPEA
jgi:hypothetical protein